MFGQIDVGAPLMQLGFGGLCLLMLGLLGWIVRRLFTMLKNDLDHIKRILDGLPCRDRECPLTGDDE